MRNADVQTSRFFVKISTVCRPSTAAFIGCFVVSASDGKMATEQWQLDSRRSDYTRSVLR